MTKQNRKPVDKLRVPLNCLISPATKEMITGTQNETHESQGEIVDRAIVLLALGEEIAPRSTKKLSRKERAIAERAASDTMAQKVERDNIDWSDVESTPATSIANLDAVGPTVMSRQGKISMEDWRKSRKPLSKPKDQK